MECIFALDGMAIPGVGIGGVGVGVGVGAGVGFGIVFWHWLGAEVLVCLPKRTTDKVDPIHFFEKNPGFGFLAQQQSATNLAMTKMEARKLLGSMRNSRKKGEGEAGPTAPPPASRTRAEQERVAGPGCPLRWSSGRTPAAKSPPRHRCTISLNPPPPGDGRGCSKTLERSAPTPMPSGGGGPGGSEGTRHWEGVPKTFGVSQPPVCPLRPLGGGGQDPAPLVINLFGKNPVWGVGKASSRKRGMTSLPSGSPVPNNHNRVGGAFELKPTLFTKKIKVELLCFALLSSSSHWGQGSI